MNMDTSSHLENAKVSNELPFFERMFSLNLEKQTRKPDAFVQVSFVVILLSVYLIYKNFKKKTVSRRSFRSTLPLVKWTGIRLPLIDGIISTIQLRKHGAGLQKILPYGPEYTMRIPCLHTEWIILGNPNHIQKTLGSSSPACLNKPNLFYDILLTKFMKGGLLGAKKEVWSRHRKALNPSFSYKSFPTCFKLIKDGVNYIVSSALEIASRSEDGTVKNTHFQPMIDLELLKIITQLIIRSETSEYFPEKEIKQFLHDYNEWKELALYRLLNPILFISPIWYFHPKRRQVDACIANMEQFELDIINHHRKLLQEQNSLQQNSEANTENQANSKDNGIKKAEKDSGDGVKPFECMVEQMIKCGLTDREICDEIATVLGGHETIGVAFQLLIFQLASNQEHLMKCHEEIDSLVNNAGGLDMLTLDDMGKLKYLERCILESLRYTPAIPFIVREVNEPVELEEGLFLEPGDIVTFTAFGVHHNPESYPNPHVFDPDRFLPENVKSRHSHAFMPFSLGPRNCIAWKISLLEMKMFMCWILYHFTMTTTDKPDDVNLDFHMTLKPERLYNITFHKRLI